MAKGPKSERDKGKIKGKIIRKGKRKDIRKKVKGRRRIIASSGA